jgi:hypothetical protein
MSFDMLMDQLVPSFGPEKLNQIHDLFNDLV